MPKASAVQSMTWRARLPRVDDIPEAVHDGDTLVVESDQGDWYRKVRYCRLFDVYAPELSQPGGQACKQFVVDWINYHNTGKWPFWVDTLQTTRGLDIQTFGRYVTIIWNADRSEQLNSAVQAFITRNGYPGGVGS